MKMPVSVPLFFVSFPLPIGAMYVQMFAYVMLLYLHSAKENFPGHLF